MTTDTISVNEVAEDLGCNPQSIREQAQRDPSKLGFPVSVVGSRVYIPREGYNNWKNGGIGMIKVYKELLAEMRRFNSTAEGATLLERLGLIERVVE